jgi:hypothetical protein
MSKLLFFLILIHTVLLFSSCKKDGCGAPQLIDPNIELIIRSSGLTDISDVIRKADESGGSVIRLNAGTTGLSSYSIGLGGEITDRWSSNSTQTNDEFGLLTLSDVPFNRLETETELPGPNTNKLLVHSQFDGNQHAITLKNKQGNKVLMETRTLIPRSFMLDSFEKKDVIQMLEGIKIQWPKPETNSGLVVILFLVTGGGENGEMEQPFYKIYKTNDVGTFFIERANYEQMTGKIAEVKVYRYNCLNVNDLRNETRKNALFLSTTWGNIIKID